MPLRQQMVLIVNSIIGSRFAGISFYGELFLQLAKLSWRVHETPTYHFTVMLAGRLMAKRRITGRNFLFGPPAPESPLG